MLHSCSIEWKALHQFVPQLWKVRWHFCTHAHPAKRPLIRASSIAAASVVQRQHICCSSSGLRWSHMPSSACTADALCPTLLPQHLPCLLMYAAISAAHLDCGGPVAARIRCAADSASCCPASCDACTPAAAAASCSASFRAAATAAARCSSCRGDRRSRLASRSNGATCERATGALAKILALITGAVHGAKWCGHVQVVHRAGPAPVAAHLQKLPASMSSICFSGARGLKPSPRRICTA